MSSYPTALQSESIINRSGDLAAELPLTAERTDGQLIDRVLAGDETAFEQLFDRHKKLVAVIAHRYFRRPEEIEEILQISFAKAFVELKNFRGRYAQSFASWLVRITSNVCYDTLRYQKRKPERLNCDLSDAEVESLVELTADTSLIAENSLVNRDLAEKLLALIPVEDCVLLQMLYSEEMNMKEIAKSLGWSVSKVKVRAWRARGMVRKVLRKFL